jgi:hypothetical protein
MKNRLILNLFFYKELDLFLNKKFNILFIKGNHGIIFLYLPRIFFIKKSDNNIRLLLNAKNIFFSILKQFLFLYRLLFKFFFFRIRLRGLGYRIKKISKKIYRFFFAFNHYFYLYVPLNVYIWVKKRYLLAISNNKAKLNNLFNHLLLLKKLSFIKNRTDSFVVPKRIVFIKKIVKKLK